MPSFEFTEARYPLRNPFAIARGTKTEARCIVCRVREGDHTGFGEGVPYPRYGEEVNAILAAANGADHNDAEGYREQLTPGAARNAIDVALWDLRAKQSGRPAHLSICADPPRPLVTAYTISLGSVDAMADAARVARGHRLLKVKLGGDDGHDASRMRAVASAASDARFIIDANEGWTAESLPELMREASRMGAVLIEQPLPVGEDAMLSGMPHPVPICADESAHTSEDLDRLVDRYDLVNIKLDKTGGLTEALRMRARARELGFGVMVGCMVGSSLAMAPAVLLAQEADYVDLDGPLLLASDREPSLHYSGSIVSPPERALWG